MHIFKSVHLSIVAIDEILKMSHYIIFIELDVIDKLFTIGRRLCLLIDILFDYNRICYAERTF